MKLFLIFQTVILVLLVLVFGSFVGVLFSESVEQYIRSLLDLSEKNDVLKFLGFSMGGILIALQALMSYKRAKAMEDAARAQAKATDEQAKANFHTETGLRQDRLKNAIKHLGHESDSVRLSGAYELFNLARGTEDLRKIVFDILCAHIRSITGESNYHKKHELKPSPQIQNLLTLLFVEQHEIFQGLRPDLQGSYLNGANLKRARLGSATLFEANLKSANLEGANLQDANLSNANLKEAFLYLGRMQGTILLDTSLQDATLVQAQLQGAMLKNTQLQGANIGLAELQGVTIARFGLSREFSKRIRTLIGKESDLSGVSLGEKVPQEDVESSIKDSGAIIGSYSKEDAERWIAEYEGTTLKKPTTDAHTGD